MADAIDSFIFRQDGVAELLGALRLSEYLNAVPPNWWRMFLNLWRSIEIVTSEACVQRRELTEMELRFVLSLCLDLKDMIETVRSAIADPIAEPAI